MSGFNDRKRSAGGDNKTSKRGVAAVAEVDEAPDGLPFEDPFGDDFEEEVIDDAAIEREGVDDEDDDEDEQELDDMGEEEDAEDDKQVNKQVWRPGIDKLEEGETLEYDPSAYIMYHSMTAEWPCLSFDFMRDGLGDGRQRFPHTMFLCLGSQADRAENNKITLAKLSDLHRTGGVVESDEEEEDDDHMDDDPTIEHVNVPHHGGINRIRAMPQNSGIIATMADNAKANIFDVQAVYQSLSGGKGPRPPAPNKPCYTFKGHKEEGYAVAWSTVEEGRLATGDCAGKIYVWNKGSGAGNADWRVDPVPYSGHTASVEDLQWSPTESTVFASCSVDKTVRIWDTRGRTGPMISVNAHKEDVNVISWSKSVGYLLASGCDDGSYKVWDLRTIRKESPIASFTYHTKQITSIEWAPHDESVLAVSSADDQVTVWDLSVEADEGEAPSGALAEFPSQLLFIHQGQKNVKETHWHPQIPNTIVTTAEDGINIFKPAISVS
jgi:ribosome assembly protein RRB1